MSKNSRKYYSASKTNSPANAKRKCRSLSDTSSKRNESTLWPDEEDESFFSNSKLDCLISNGQMLYSDEHDMGHLNVDDSLFSDINVTHVCAASEMPTTTTQLPSPPSLPSTTTALQPSPTLITTESNPALSFDDTLFSDIKFEEFTAADDNGEVNLFDDEFPLELEIQNTQRFLNDVAFKVPNAPKKEDTSHCKSLNCSISDGLVQGSQYETSDEIQNRSMQTESLVTGATQVLHREVGNLSHINWETQAFPEVVNTFPSKGQFYGLPDRVKHLIFEHKGIKNLYEWQDECLNLPAIKNRKNLIYALPTSGGKTLVAEILMLREIICREKNVLFVLPYVSIVQEKVSAMSPFAIALDFIVDEYTAGKGKCPPTARKKRKSIFIASIEKGAVLLDSLIDAKRANEIGLVVIDELHLIGEKGRGATLEALLTKVMFLNAGIQIVGMSATIGNLSEISAFLQADVYTRGFRPVELREYIKCGNDILEINTAGKTLEEVFIHKRCVNYNYSSSVARADPDHLAGLVAECAPANCCLIFCSSRKNCENVAVLLSRILPKSKFLEHRQGEKVDLMDALDKVCGVLSPVLAKTIPFGIAYHHSGLTTDERKFIETAYRFGVISVICCTSTLAAGVNLPAKRVIIRAPYVGNEFMNLCKYKQMVGRAGRAGMGEAGESILISSSRDNVRVGEMLFSPMDKAISSLDHNDGIGLQGLMLSAIGLELAACRKDLYRLINSTLLAVQADHLGVSTDDLVLNVVREMFKNKVLETNSNEKNTSSILTTQDTTSYRSQDRRVFISKTTRFRLTTIGRAAFKAGIDYKRTRVIYNELQAAQKQLLLSNYAHLLYLVVCFNSNEKGDELFTADAGILFRLYTTVDENTQALFKLLGFTEAQAAKIAKTLSVQGPMELILNRLFKVLILADILSVEPLPAVASKYNIERGMLQNMISQATAASSAIVRLCEQVDNFWCYKPLFERISAKMDRCGTMELEPLLELPAVKINRAKQLYSAGFKTIEDIAKSRPIELAEAIEHLPLKIAKEMISAAKIILMKKLDHLEEETEVLKSCLKQND